MRALLEEYRPRAIINFAAETHVDRSILYPEEFVQANVMGTFNLLVEARQYWSGLPEGEKSGFKFLQVSTDEVYGALLPDDPPCDERTAPAPNSPYAASKAAANQFVRAFIKPMAYPRRLRDAPTTTAPISIQKLIPHIIHKALRQEPLPIYGDGRQIRDWLYVDDHCAALRCILARGAPARSTTSARVPSTPTCRWSALSVRCWTANRRANRGAMLTLSPTWWIVPGTIGAMA